MQIKNIVDVAPVGEWLLINPVKKHQSLIVPKGATDNEIVKGVVITRGEGTDDIIMEVQRKDMVLFPSGAGITIQVKNQKFILIRQSEIFARL